MWALTRAGAVWTDQSGKLTGGAEEAGAGLLGTSVSLSSDGATALAGARADANNAGAGWVFARSGSTWAQQGPKLTAAGELGEGQLGSSTALSASGNTALLGAPHDNALVGAAWAFSRSGASWTQQQVLRAGDSASEGVQTAFATDVALAGDGASALIGSKRPDHRLGTAWSFAGNVEPIVPPVEPVVPPSEPEATSSAGSAGGEPVVNGPLARAGGARVGHHGAAAAETGADRQRHSTLGDRARETARLVEIHSARRRRADSLRQRGRHAARPSLGDHGRRARRDTDDGLLPRRVQADAAQERAWSPRRCSAEISRRARHRAALAPGPVERDAQSVPFASCGPKAMAVTRPRATTRRALCWERDG